MRMRRRPLVRAAMVGGGAYAAGKARQRGQTRQADEEQRLGALEQQSAAGAPAPAAPAAAQGSGDLVEKLKELKELQDSGALTPDQFEAAKQKLLQS
jgi:Short C-terminal domain